LRPVNHYIRLATITLYDEDAPRSLTDPGLWSLATHRFGRWAAKLAPAPLRSVGSKAYGGLLLLVQVTTGNIIYQEVKVGADLDIRGARNVLIHPGVEIGDRCRIGSNVTLGTNGRFKVGAPKVGNDVIIETGAKILGPVTIGDRAIIRANSLVLINVPAGATAIGVPARYSVPKSVADGAPAANANVNANEATAVQIHPGTSGH